MRGYRVISPRCMSADILVALLLLKCANTEVFDSAAVQQWAAPEVHILHPASGQIVSTSWQYILVLSTYIT